MFVSREIVSQNSKYGTFTPGIAMRLSAAGCFSLLTATLNSDTVVWRSRNCLKLLRYAQLSRRRDGKVRFIPTDCDFSHITHMRLVASTSARYNFDALRPLLHADLESLSLACTPPFARMKMHSLKQVELFYFPHGNSPNFNSDPYLDQFFDALDAIQLETCTLEHFPALDVLNCLHKCNARAVCYKLETVDFHTTLAVQTIDDAFRKAVANGITVKDFTLDLCYFEDNEEHFDPDADYSDLVAFLRGIVKLKKSHWETLRVHIEADTWQLWETRLRGFAETLTPFVTF